MRLTFDRTAAFLKPRLVYAKIAGALVWLTWAVTSAISGGSYDLLGQIIGVDHLAFYSPARMIREGRGADIYEAEKIAAYQTSLFPPGVWDDEYEAYRNPPFYALLYYPTSGLSYAASCWIWFGISIACYVAGVHLLKTERPWRYVLWGATFLPVFSVIGYGQNSLLSFGILCATYRLLLGGHRFAAGMVAGLLWFKPPLLIGLVVWGLLDIRRLWPCALGVAATGALLTFGTYPIIPEVWDGFFASLKENVRFENFEQWKMHNPRAFWKLLLPGLAPIPGILWLVFVAVGLWCFVRVWRANRGNLPVLLAASTFLMLWISPHTMFYEWSLAVIPAVLLWEHRPELRGRWLVLFAVGWVVLFTGTDASRLQVRIQEWLKVEPVIVFQYSVVFLGWIGWEVTRLLTTPTSRREAVQPVETGGSHGENAAPATETTAPAP